jgi:hypothetical protein
MLAVAAAALAALPAASTAKGKASHAHVIVSFSGSGSGHYNYDVPEDPGPSVCYDEPMSYTMSYHYTFDWTAMFTSDGAQISTKVKSAGGSGTSDTNIPFVTDDTPCAESGVPTPTDVTCQAVLKKPVGDADGFPEPLYTPGHGSSKAGFEVSGLRA